MLALVTCDRWHLTPDMWHMTPDTWNLTPDTWFYFYLFLSVLLSAQLERLSISRMLNFLLLNVVLYIKKSWLHNCTIRKSVYSCSDFSSDLVNSKLGLSAYHRTIYHTNDIRFQTISLFQRNTKIEVHYNYYYNQFYYYYYYYCSELYLKKISLACPIV